MNAFEILNKLGVPLWARFLFGNLFFTPVKWVSIPAILALIYYFVA